MGTKARFSYVLFSVMIIGMAVGCEELEDGTRICSDERDRGCPSGYVCRRYNCTYETYFCYRRQDVDRESYFGPPCVVNGQCELRACETWFNCPEDCGARCDIPAMTGSTSSNSIASEFYFPMTSAEAKEVGVDLNGDGVVNNKLGMLLDLLVSFELIDDPAVAMQRSLESGELILIGRFWREEDTEGEDPRGLAQLLVGEVVDASPIFDGTDIVRISSEASSATYLCGRLFEGVFRSERSPSPVRLPLPLAVPGDNIFVGSFTHVRVEGRIGPEGWTEVQVGGGITRETLVAELYPWLVDQINREILRDPSSERAATALDLFDDNCESTLPGCDPPPQGCAEDGLISFDELYCNALLSSAVAPDVDLDGDGIKDVMSAGYRIVSTVPVTLVE